jgi:hypothetical protein
MKKMKSDKFNQYSKKMSQKIDKIIDPKTVEGMDIEKEYQLIQERKSKLSANMREAITYHMSVKTIQKEKDKKAEEEKNKGEEK